MKLRNLFSRPRPTEKAGVVQTAPRQNGFAGIMGGYHPLITGDSRLYEAMRMNIPIIDAAIDKIVRLTGGFTVTCDNKALQNELGEFLSTVRVGASQVGIDAFVTSYLDQMLMYGTAVAEIVPNVGCTDIAALYNAPLDGLEIVAGDNPFDTAVCRREYGTLIPAPYQQLIMHSALHPAAGSVTGVSLLASMPFAADILMKIYNCIGQNFERMGNLRYAVTYHPSGDGDRVSAKERAMQIAEQWTGAMQSREVRDFVAVGDVDIKVIGADSQMLSTEIPVRQMLEQIVAKTGLPPFMLGLSWSSTERMSAQQADILTSELEYYRSLLTPVILQICNMWQRMHGSAQKLTVEWNCINMQDEIDLAKARLYNAEAAQIENKLKGEK